MHQKLKMKIVLLMSKFFIIFYKCLYGSRVEFGKNVIINHKFRINGKGRLLIGEGVNLWTHEEKNRFFFYHQNATIYIGKESRINGLTCHCVASITLGKHCLIASATILDTDFHAFSDSSHVLYGNPVSKPVSIGNGVWLCGQSVVLKGVQIGDASVAGYRAVVTKTFPANVVIAGNPAKIVKQKT